MEQPGRTAGPHQALALAARWLGRESPAGARSAYVAGSSLALTLFLLATPLAADGVRLNADTAWAFASAWAVVGGCVHLLHAALTLVPPWRRWADLRLTLAAGGTFAFCLVLRLHYTWFGAHLMTADALEMAVDGVRAGDVDLGVGNVLLLLAGIAVGALLSLPVLALLSRVSKLFAPLAYALPLCAVLVVGGQGVAVDERDPSAARLTAHVPWSGARGQSLVAAAGARAGAAVQDENVFIADAGRFAEQRASLLGDDLSAGSRPDMLMIVLESFRGDLLDPKITPNMSRLADRCITTTHYASGTNTHSGLFSLLHGLSPFQYHAFTDRKLRPLPTTILKRLGYKMAMWRTNHLKHRRIYELFFSQEFERDTFISKGRQTDRERKIIKALLDDLGNRGKDDDPHFDLLFPYTTHWSYFYEKAFARFRPVSPGGLPMRHGTDNSGLKKHARGLRNRQRNSAVFQDHLLGEVFDALERQGRLDSMVIAITGDHGEEFFEHGRVGHTYGLSREITQVPFVLCLPGVRSIERRYSSHHDIFPTIFDHIDLNRDLRAFMNGRSLISEDPGPDIGLTATPIMRGDEQMAVISDGVKVRFDRGGAVVKVTDEDDEPMAAAGANALVDKALRLQRLWPADAADASAGADGAAGEGADGGSPALAELRDDLRHQRWLLDRMLRAPEWAWGADDRAGPIDPRALTAAPWTVKRFKRTGKRFKRDAEMEFLQDGRIGLGNIGHRKKWMVRGARLYLIDRYGRPTAELRYDPSKKKLGGMEPDGLSLVLHRQAMAVRPRVADGHWTREDMGAPVTPELLTQGLWTYDHLGQHGKRKTGGTLTFLPNGDLGQGRSFDLDTWEIVGGRLYLRNSASLFSGRLHLDPDTGKLAGPFANVSNRPRYLDTLVLSRPDPDGAPASP